jgi:hypothetical protein
MDTLGKPSFPAESCPPCAGFSALEAKMGDRVCHGCEEVISDTDVFGYESQTVDHWHISALGDKVAFKVVKRRLCAACYRKDWKKAYPKVKCPV